MTYNQNMFTRRKFVKTLAAIPPALSFPNVQAASDSSRLALVIGNNDYPDAPLANPINDAKAIGGLFHQAGFIVDTHFNTKRNDMIGAIEHFGSRAKLSETALVVFYYAGHGAQLAWRNYLLPVDAVVEKEEDIRQRCVDLNLLLGQLSAAKDKTFVIILDACRNNPFGTSYKPEQKGLSQFDAPVGSLLAYATSPGSFAADGQGANGLYTENLVRELGRRGTRIEDALKRVRLNVRLASHGEQIPWETTSLENDIFIFPEAGKKLSESEQIQLVEADIAEWSRIKSSRKFEDWRNYLLNFPNGRFAEIAQARLNSLLTETEKPVAPNIAEVPAAPPVSMIELGEGRPVPQLVQVSQNPNSAGRYPLGRKFSVGDEFGLIHYDLLTNVETPRLLRVTSIDTANDRVLVNDGEYIWDQMGNVFKTPEQQLSSVPRQFFPAELQLGKKWTAAWDIDHSKFGHIVVTSNFQIVAYEPVLVPAGRFEAFVSTFTGWDTTSRSFLGKNWIVPGLNVCVRQELWVKNRFGRFSLADGFKLASLRQHAMDSTCTIPAEGRGRNAVIKNMCA